MVSLILKKDAMSFKAVANRSASEDRFTLVQGNVVHRINPLPPSDAVRNQKILC